MHHLDVRLRCVYRSLRKRYQAMFGQRRRDLWNGRDVAEPSGLCDGVRLHAKYRRMRHFLYREYRLRHGIGIRLFNQQRKHRELQEGPGAILRSRRRLRKRLLRPERPEQSVL